MNKKIKNIFRICISFLLICFLLSKINLKDLTIVFYNVNLKIIFISLLINFIFIILSAYKWNSLLKKVPLISLIKSIFQSKFFSMVLPGQLFGEASKIYTLRNENVDSENCTTSILIDKLTSLIALLLLSFVGILFSENKIVNNIKIVYFICLIIFIIMLFTPKISILDKLIKKVLYHLINNNSKIIKKIGNFIKNMYNAWTFCVSNNKNTIYTILMGIICQLLCVAEQFIIINYLNIDISFVDIMWIFPTVSILLLIPITVGGIGLRELSYATIFSYFGVSNELTLVFTTILFIVNIIIAIVGGILVLEKQITKK